MISLLIFLLSTITLSTQSNFTVDQANDFIANNQNSVIQTYRNKYHFMAPIGWINDPNGFIFYKNEYHLFYQFNPYASKAANMHWGHAKSVDLIKWEHLPVALAPDHDYDDFGVFSGSAVEKDGRLYVMYTGSSANNTRQVQCMAVSDDGITFEKLPENPVLTEASLPPNAQPQDFRDPKIIENNGTYYVVLASKTLNNTGQILLYQSQDLIQWEYKSILLEGDENQGIMWECPDLFNINGKDVLIISPIQIPRNGSDFHNIDSVVEFVGVVDWNEGKFNVEYMREIDHGMDIYATQTILDGFGRRIAISWMAMWGRNYPTDTLNHLWTGSMTLPRIINFEQNQLVQAPIDSIFQYTQSLVELENITLIDELREFEQVVGEVAVLELEIDLSKANLFDLELRVNQNESTIVSYSVESSQLYLSRLVSGITIEGDENPPVFMRNINVPLINQKLKLLVFLDQSSVEIFVNDGLETMTATIYPTQVNSGGIRIGVVGEITLEKLKFALIQV